MGGATSGQPESVGRGESSTILILISRRCHNMIVDSPWLLFLVCHHTKIDEPRGSKRVPAPQLAEAIKCHHRSQFPRRMPTWLAHLKCHFTLAIPPHPDLMAISWPIINSTLPSYSTVRMQHTMYRREKGAVLCAMLRILMYFCRCLQQEDSPLTAHAFR